MTDERKQVKEIVGWAVKDTHRWLTDHVAGFAVATEEMRHDWIFYAESISQSLLFIERLLCDCSYKGCSRQHSLASRTPAEPIERFVRRAVIGPGGLKANSIIKGMLFPYLKDHELKKVKVEFKQCPTCQTKYEGSVCANPECREPFDPCTTAVIGREWLIKKGAYAPIRRWGCSHQLRCAETIRKHYYEQIRCREKPAWRKDGEPTLRVRHNDEEHDCCPWHSCPNCGERHKERGRGTTLWIQAGFLGGDEPPRQRDVLESLIASIEQVNEELSGDWRELFDRLGDDEVNTAVVLIEEGTSASTLRRAYPELQEAEIEVLCNEVRPSLLAVIRQQLEKRGIGERRENSVELNPTPKTRQTVSHEDVVGEVKHLLQACRIAPGEDISKRGNRLDVIVGTWDSETDDTFDVSVVVYGVGGQPVTIEGLRVMLFQETDENVVEMRVGTIKTYGQDRGGVSFLNLSAGVYNVQIAERADLRYVCIPENREVVFNLSHRVLEAVAPSEVATFGDELGERIETLINLAGRGKVRRMGDVHQAAAFGAVEFMVDVVVPVVASVVTQLLAEFDQVDFHALKAEDIQRRKKIRPREIRPIVEQTESPAGRRNLHRLAKALNEALEGYSQVQ